MYIYIPSINTTNHIKAVCKNNYMFRPCYRAIVNLYRTTGDYIIGMGYYLGDEISSYIVVLGVKAGYQHIYVYVSLI